MIRRKSRKVFVGNIAIGGDSDISVQSMLNIPSTSIKENVKQAIALEKAGCDIIRVAVPDMKAVELIYALKKDLKTPIVADIHFDYHLALESVNAGVDKIRINPGNIGSEDRIKAVAKECKLKGVPIRVGVNSGSIEKEILSKYGHPTPEAMRDSALFHASLLEKFDFHDIVLSLKSSNVEDTFAAYKLVSEACDYPLHLGITEAGTKDLGIIKSSIGIGALLLNGIGDTIRVSLTADPVHEVLAGNEILKSLNLRKSGISFVSCPTCGRTKIDLIAIANEVQSRLKDCDKSIKVAVMGCAVNGPGEAKEADIGIAGGDGFGLLFKKGEIVKKVKENELIDELVNEIDKM